MKARILLYQEAMRRVEEAKLEASKAKPSGFTNRLYQATMNDDGTVSVSTKSAEPVGDRKITGLPFQQVLVLSNAELQDLKALFEWFDDTFWGERGALALNLDRARTERKQMEGEIKEKAPQLSEIISILTANARPGQSMLDTFHEMTKPKD